MKKLEFNYINGQFVGYSEGAHNTAEFVLTKYLVEGENEIELTLSNTLRNLLGPHHLLSGEPHLIEPQSFYEDYHPFKPGKTERHKGYCFVETGVKSE